MSTGTSPSPTAPVRTVAVIGLGAMGGRMAARIAGAGFAVVGWNRTPRPADELASAGVETVPSPAEAARRADVVVTMLRDGDAVLEVVRAADGLAAAMAPGSVLVESSTAGPSAVAELRRAVPEAVAVLDAPVLGSLSEVEGGTLQVFAGGPSDAYERCLPVFRALGEPRHVGPLGAGAAAKLVANSTLLGCLGVLGEALALGAALGLDRDRVFEVLATTPLAAQAERRRPGVESGAPPVRFRLELARKDASLVAGEADGHGLALELAPAVLRWFADAVEVGRGDDDYSAVLGHLLERGVAARRR